MQSVKMRLYLLLKVAICGLSLTSFALADWTNLCGGIKTRSRKLLGKQLPVNCTQYETTVYCEGATFEALPQSFPLSTTCLVIDSGFLTQLNSTDLSYLKNLEIFGVVNTPLRHLGGTFGSGRDLRKLIFQKTNLEILPEIVGDVETLEITESNLTSLDPSPIAKSALLSLRVSGNPISSLKSEFLQVLPKSLTTLEISDCPIEQVDKGTFPSLPKLQRFAISSKVVGTNAFQGLASTKTFKIETCQINSYAFASLKRVDFLDLSYSCKFGANNLILQRYAFSGMESLTNLNLDYSGLQQIPTKAFTGLPTIKVITVRYNPLRYVMQGAFDGLKSLEEVHLSNVVKSRSETNIVLLGDNTFSYANLTNLRVLDLEHLNLYNITLPTFLRLPNLETVYFSSNFLHFLQNGTLSLVPKLLSVRLGDNPYRCDCNIRWLREMMMSRQGLFEDLEDVRCGSPEILKGKRFIDLLPHEFKCPTYTVIG